MNVYVVIAGTEPVVFQTQADAERYADASGNAPVHTCAVRDSDDVAELLEIFA